MTAAAKAAEFASKDNLERGLDGLRSEMKAGFAMIDQQLDQRFAMLDQRFDTLDQRFALFENRVVIKTGVMMVVVAGLAVAALRYLTCGHP